MDRQSQVLKSSSDVNEPGLSPIGKDGETLRVLNFSGGGFDTVMQLGVTHALLVGRRNPPDIVVGISAGAVQAAALAEVMTVGGVESPGNIDEQQYRKLIKSRVCKFREYVSACFRAPNTILDSVLPDAYQIDSFDPLASLQLPRLPAKEREDRKDWIEKKSGLIRLYNDLLSVDLPFGTVSSACFAGFLDSGR